MLADSLTQFMVKNWKDWFLVVGPDNEDKDLRMH